MFRIGQGFDVHQLTGISPSLAQTLEVDAGIILCNNNISETIFNESEKRIFVVIFKNESHMITITSDSMICAPVCDVSFTLFHLFKFY